MLHDDILLYASPNGDRWYLVRDADPERLSVRHEPNRASGGQPTVMGTDEFLAEGNGPQHEALRRHLDQLAGVPTNRLRTAFPRIARGALRGGRTAR